jgi:hypothetical protein
MAIKNNPAMNSQAKTSSSKKKGFLIALLNCSVELELKKRRQLLIKDIRILMKFFMCFKNFHTNF